MEEENADGRMRRASTSDDGDSAENNHACVVNNAFEVLMRRGQTSAVRRRRHGGIEVREEKRRRVRNDNNNISYDDVDGRNRTQQPAKGEREIAEAELEASGIDLAFLNALPPALRAEVLATQVPRRLADASVPRRLADASAPRRRQSGSTASAAVEALSGAATLLPAAGARDTGTEAIRLGQKKEQPALPCEGTNAFAVLMERRDADASTRLPGNHIIEAFITPEEEEEIVGRLDADMRNPWKTCTFSGLYYGKRYGVRVEYGPRRMVLPSEFSMPSWLSAVVVRIEEAVKRFTGEDFAINECNAIDYRRTEGHWLSPHVDDRQSSTSIIVNLSLVGDASMTYVSERKRATKRISVPLQRRALQIQSGPCRYDFTHSIQNCDLYAPRRVSITFRESPL